MTALETISQFKDLREGFGLMIHTLIKENQVDNNNNNVNNDKNKEEKSKNKKKKRKRKDEKLTDPYYRIGICGFCDSWYQKLRKLNLNKEKHNIDFISVCSDCYEKADKFYNQ